MANNQKPAAKMSKLPSSGAQPKVIKENIQPRSSTAARPTSALKPLQTHTSSNGAKYSEMVSMKDAETAALVTSLQG